MQISESHCGPATLQMLMSAAGVEVTQEAVAEAGGATELIELNGMRVDQLAQAAETLAPELLFWHKQHSSLQDLITLVARYGLPVGVEWQGLFDDSGSEESETGSEDYGHYSAVTHVNLETSQLIIADPYKDYISQDRVFGFDEFESRWYDYNEIPDSTTGQDRLVKDDHMMFVVVPRGETFPREIEMKPGPPGYENI